MNNESRWRTLMGATSEVVVVLDATGVVSYCSPAIDRILGYAEEDIVGTSHFALIHADDRHGARSEFEQLFHGRTCRPGMTLRLATKQRAWRRFAVTARNFLTDPSISGIVISLRDVTETHELEQQLLHARRMKILGQLTAGIAHDSNNLLTLILSYVDLMASAPDLSVVAKMAAEVRGIAVRAAALSHDLTAFTQRHTANPQNVDLNILVARVHRLLDRAVGERITFECVLSPDSPHVRVDPSLFEQVLVNLSVNARDAMPTGGTLRVTTNLLPRSANPDSPNDPTSGWVSIVVSDTGIGMSEETRSRIFEPFFTTKPVGQGSGLGLATVYGIVAQAAGRIAVTSELGQGTAFEILLPAVAPDPAPIDGTDR